MAARPVWRGTLRLALVSCPVALHTARRSAGELHFNLINPATGNRTRTQLLDAGTDREVERSALVHGFPVAKDEYVLLSDEDFESARIESSSVLDIGKFVPADSIDPTYYDATYWLAPDETSGRKDDRLGQDIFVVLREAIARAKAAALSRVVLSRRERAVAILPRGRGLVVHTLHDQREIADPAGLFEGLPSSAPDEQMVTLALQLIERQRAKFDPADIEDRYEKRLREIVAAKSRGKTPKARAVREPRGDNVVDLMAALRRSLGQDAPAPKRKAASRPKKATAPRKPVAAKRPARKAAR